MIWLCTICFTILHVKLSSWVYSFHPLIYFYFLLYIMVLQLHPSTCLVFCILQQCYKYRNDWVYNFRWTSFYSFAVIPSEADTLEGSNFSKTFFILFFVNVIFDMSGYLAPSIEGVFLSSLKKMLLNWLFWISAISRSWT